MTATATDRPRRARSARARPEADLAVLVLALSAFRGQLRDLAHGLLLPRPDPEERALLLEALEVLERHGAA